MITRTYGVHDGYVVRILTDEELTPQTRHRIATEAIRRVDACLIDQIDPPWHLRVCGHHVTIEPEITDSRRADLGAVLLGALIGVLIWALWVLA